MDEKIDDVKKSADQMRSLLTARRDAEDLAAVGDLERRLAIFLDGRAEVLRLNQEGKKDAGLKLIVRIQGKDSKLSAIWRSSSALAF